MSGARCLPPLRHHPRRRHRCAAARREKAEGGCGGGLVRGAEAPPTWPQAARQLSGNERQRPAHSLAVFRAVAAVLSSFAGPIAARKAYGKLQCRALAVPSKHTAPLHQAGTALCVSGFVQLAAIRHVDWLAVRPGADHLASARLRHHAEGFRTARRGKVRAERVLAGPRAARCSRRIELYAASVPRTIATVADAVERVFGCA